MKFIETEIRDIKIIQPDVYGDQRGFFLEYWHKEKFRQAGIDAEFVQDNHSASCRNTLRGLHYQLVRPQGKLVRAIAGEVYDVAVDIRKSSPTFGQWVGEIISADLKNMIWVPPGFAHGFLVTSEHAEIIYKCTDFYTPEHERSILWNDPDLAISWPLIADELPLLSEKDINGLPFKEAEYYP